MNSIFGIEIAQPTRPTRHCTHRTIATCWELLISVFCSILCSSYILRAEERANNGISPTFHLPPADEGHFPWILDPPPPALMLGASLALGCAVSSFAYRRHESDRYQTPVFVLALTTAAIAGIARGWGGNLIMLALMPWALCGAMFASVGVHAIRRRCCRRPLAFSETHCCERGEKEPEITKS